MGLSFVKIGVDAVVCEEGVVGSVFGDAAVVEDDDAVAEFATAHAVGDVDGGFAGGHLAELFVDFGFGDGVEGGGRLVKDDERGVFVEARAMAVRWLRRRRGPHRSRCCCRGGCGCPAGADGRSR